MSDLRHAAACASLALAILMPAVVRGQGGDVLSRLRAAAVAASAALERVQDRQRLDSIARLALPVVRDKAGVTVRADTTIASARFMKAFDDAFDGAQREARSVFGSAADTLLRGFNIAISRSTFEVVDSQPPRYAAVTVTDALDNSPNAGDRPFAAVAASQSMEHTTTPDVERLTYRFLELYSLRAARFAPPAYTRWAGPTIPVRVRAEQLNRSAYVRLNQRNAEYSRNCAAGSLSACKHALALDPADDTARTKEHFNRAFFSLPPNAELALDPELRAFIPRECVGRRSELVCRRIRGSAWKENITEPTTRQYVMWRALKQGGPDAFTRMVASPGNDVSALLAAAAGAPADSVVAEWMEEMIATAPVSPMPSAVQLLVGLAMCAALVSVAAAGRP